MDDPLRDSQAKIEWANQHLQRLERLTIGFLKTDPYAAVVQYEADGLEQVFTLDVRAQPRPRLGLAIGDVVHNARSALDIAVVSLANHTLQKAGGAPLTEDEERKLQFPVCRCEAEFVEHVERRLGPLTPEAQAFVEGCQPYHGGESLAHLEKFSNIDKHRRLHVLAALRTGDTVLALLPGVPQPTRLPGLGPLEGGAEIMRYVFPAPHAYVDVKPEFAFSIAVPEVARPPVAEVLGEILAVVEMQVLRGLRTFF